MGTPDALEDRLRAVEDTLAIYHLIASHPPAADTGTDRYYRDAFTSDGQIDLGGGKGATGHEAIAGIVSTRQRLPVVSVILPDCRAWSSMAIPRWQRLICRSSRPIGMVRRELSGHGTSTGFRIHRVGANRWELKREKDGWKVTRRTLRPLDGGDDAQALLRQAFAQ